MGIPSKTNKSKFKGRASSDKQGLTQRQYLFCEYYLQTGVASTAYIKAGYSPNNKYSGSSELMSNPKVRDYLKRARKARHKNFLVTKERALKELSKIAKGLKKEEVPMLMKTVYMENGKEVGAEVSPVIVKKKVDGKVQLQALKEVFKLYEDNNGEDAIGQTTDDKLLEAMKARVTSANELQLLQDKQKFEEDEELEEDDDE